MNKLSVLVFAVLMACPALSLAGEGSGAGGNATDSTTVKSSKSNSSDRSGGNAGGGAAAGTTVKGSKSNSSERSGGNPGEGPAEGTTVRSGKSNSDN